MFTQPRKTRVARRRRSGFTLIELLLVLVILAILAAIVVPRFTGQDEKARVRATQTSIAQIEQAIERFRLETGRYPNSDEGVKALLERPADVKDWSQGFQKLPKDGWDQEFVYRFPGTNNPTGFDLLSVGPDHQEGGTDDITNWGEKR